MKILGLIIVLLVAKIASAEPKPENKPIDQLPAQVESTAGLASIFIDIAKDPQAHATVYLINRGNKTVELVNDNGHLRLYWEAETKPQQWERASVQHWDQCGTGIGVHQIPPGQWTKQSAQILDKTAAVPEAIEYNMRLCCYSASFQVSSNTVRGYAVPRLIDEAKNDLLAISMASFERLANILRGQDPVSQQKNQALTGMGDIRYSALWALQQHQDRQQVVKLLQSLSAESPELRELVTPTLQELQKK
jgi:hypothetical protein